MGHIDTTRYRITFGKHKGKSVADLPSDYLRWLCGEDWVEEKHEQLFELAQAELNWRDEMGQHCEED